MPALRALAKWAWLAPVAVTIFGGVDPPGAANAAVESAELAHHSFLGHRYSGHGRAGRADRIGQ